MDAWSDLNLGDRVEFPLQYLGEALIHQSILYEGNPDSTKIRERFRYNFDAPSSSNEVSTETDAASQLQTAANGTTDSMNQNTESVGMGLPTDQVVLNTTQPAGEKQTSSTSTSNTNADTDMVD